MASARSIIAFWGGMLILMAVAVVSNPEFEPDNNRGQAPEASDQRAGEPAVEQQSVAPGNSSPADLSAQIGDPEDEAETTNNQGEGGGSMGWIETWWGNVPSDSLPQWIMALFAVAALITSIWGVVLLRENLNVSQDLVRQDRAWVTVLSNPQPTLLGDPNHPSFIMYDFVIKNTGRTPALSVRCFMANGTDPLPENFFLNAARIAKFLPLGEVTGPDCFISKKLTLSDEAMTNIELGAVHVVYIVCFYETIYGETYFFERCAESVYMQINGQRFLNWRSRKGNNRFIPITREDSYKGTEGEADPDKVYTGNPT